ncbi:MAG: Rpn family recombination-promoting nuclease/putative transposase, partial [Victivallales bacterium]|nr:Rpn family recombination-promoting nuclease/putative transposase [Victivallales bacterium]
YEVISDRNRSRPTTTRDSGEFLYGFHMDDRLSPVITLVIHWGRMKWTAPLSFHELVKDTMPSVRDYIPNFRLPLLVATDFAEKKQHIDEPNLDLLLHYVGNVFAGKRKEFQVELDTNPFYQNIRAATGQCINAITGDCLPVPGNPEETFSMKTAGELYREELRNEGRKAGMKAGMKAGRKAGMKAGRKEGMKEGKQIFFRMFVESSRRKNRSDAEIQQFLMEDFKLTSEEAKELVNQ